MTDDQKALFNFLLQNNPNKGTRAFSLFVMRIRLFWKALLSVLFQQRKLFDPIACDVLLIHPSRKSFLQGRKKPLISALKARGLNVEEFVELGDRDSIKHRSFLAPCRPVPLLFRWYAAHAEYLLNRYKAQIILTERNGWIIPSFIKMLRHDGSKVVHLAHSVTTSQSSRYRYFDYDYYFLFGRSSLEYLSALPNTFGQCVVHYCGPYFLSDKESFPDDRAGISDHDDIRCLLLAPGPAYESSPDYLECCAWVMDWLAENKAARLWIKLHPRGAGAWWLDRLSENERIFILPEGTSLDDCAARFDLVFSNYTNAIVDIARYATPFVLLGAGKDYFAVEQFGISRARSVAQLKDSVDAILADPALYKKRVLGFFAFHVENRRFPLTSIVDSVVFLADKKSIPGVHLKSFENSLLRLSKATTRMEQRECRFGLD